jgi:hypothetical protein
MKYIFGIKVFFQKTNLGGTREMGLIKGRGRMTLMNDRKK